LTIGLVFPMGAAAQVDEAGAEALFDRAMADFNAGKLDTACPGFEESYRLDPRPGSLFTVATCHAKAGRSATAVARYKDYLKVYATLTPTQQRAQKGRDKAAEDAIAELEPQVAKLTVTLRAGAPADAVVKRDGVALGGPSLGVPLPVDPGDHVVSVERPGSPPREERVHLAAGEARSLELAAPDAAAPPETPPATPPPEASAPPSRTAAYVAFGVGGASLAASLILGAVVLGKKSTVNQNCTGHDCNTIGKEAADTGETLAAVSTVTFGVGLAAAAAGTAILLLQPKVKPATGLRLRPIVAASPSGAFVGVGGVLR
jgi:hypothetical protein